MLRSVGPPSSLVAAAVLAVSLPCAGVSGAEPRRQAPGAPRLVLLVRHAEAATGEGRDPGLSDAGRARAQALAEALQGARLARVVTSTLRRARDTGSPAAERGGVPLVAVPVTREGGLARHVAGVVEAVHAAEPGGAVLVVGHSNTVPRVVEALGGPSLADMDHDDHSSLFVVTVGLDGDASFVHARLGGTTAQLAPMPEAGDPSDPCPGAEFPEAATSPYVLPYPVGESHNVRQGNCNELNTHHARLRETYAYDFEMPVGSRIVAARGGRVIAVVERFTDDQHGLHEGNVVAIEHDDGTYAKYGHLTHEGALVDVGDVVLTGQPIALSGNSGLSRGPHLHFSVKRCPDGERIGGPTCVTVPVTFRNTRPHPRGLIGSPTSEVGGGEWYEALP